MKCPADGDCLSCLAGATGVERRECAEGAEA